MKLSTLFASVAVFPSPLVLGSPNKPANNNHHPSHLQRHTLTTTRGIKYTYYTTPITAATDLSAPALFFFHGFPDNAALWSSTIDHILNQGPTPFPNRIIAPDLLGYDGTDKPLGPAAYDYAMQSQDMVEILDAQNISSVIVVGHDWGVGLASRFIHHKRSYTRGLVLVSISYLLPTLDPNAPPFNLTANNLLYEQLVGYPLYAYWELFGSSNPDGTAGGAAALEANLTRSYQLAHSDSPGDDGFTWMRTLWCQYGAVRSFLAGTHPLNDAPPNLKPYAHDPEFRRDFLRRMKRDGFAAPLNWYRATITDVHRVSDLTISPSLLNLTFPVLFVGSYGDAVGRHEFIENNRHLLPDLETHVVHSGHWIPYEVPDQLGGRIWSWVTRRFPSSST